MERTTKSIHIMKQGENSNWKSNFDLKERSILRVKKAVWSYLKFVGTNLFRCFFLLIPISK